MSQIGYVEPLDFSNYLPCAGISLSKLEYSLPDVISSIPGLF